MSLGELAHNILYKKKTKRLLESATGMAASIQSKVIGLGKELKAAGEDVTDEEVQGALLMAALEDKGKLDNIEPEEVKAIANQIKESRGYTLSESGGGLIHIVELAGNILGNTALLNVIASAVEKVTGKKINPGLLKSTINEMMSSLKEITGLPAKAMEKFFALISKVLGGGETAQKIAGYAGTFIVVLTFFGLGAAFFPVLGASPLMIILSLTGLIGKGFELKGLWDHLKHAIEDYKAEKGKGSETLPDLQLA